MQQPLKAHECGFTAALCRSFMVLCAPRRQAHTAPGMVGDPFGMKTRQKQLQMQFGLPDLLQCAVAAQHHPSPHWDPSAPIFFPIRSPSNQRWSMFMTGMVVGCLKHAAMQTLHPALH